MKNLFDNIKALNSIKYFIFVYVGTFLYSLFYGKISGWYYEKEIKKIMETKCEIANELIDELIKEEAIRDKWEEYYDCLCKSLIYLVMGIASLGQLIIIMINSSIDLVSANVCMLTMLISFLEFRDNKSNSRRMKKKLDLEMRKIINNVADIKEMALQDFVLEDMVKKNLINNEKRVDMIKEMSRDISK